MSTLVTLTEGKKSSVELEKLLLAREKITSFGAAESQSGGGPVSALFETSSVLICRKLIMLTLIEGSEPEKRLL